MVLLPASPQIVGGAARKCCCLRGSWLTRPALATAVLDAATMAEEEKRTSPARGSDGENASEPTARTCQCRCVTAPAEGTL